MTWKDILKEDKGLLTSLSPKEKKKIKKIPIANPKSPTLFTINALIAAALAVGFLNQKPIKR